MHKAPCRAQCVSRSCHQLAQLPAAPAPESAEEVIVSRPFTMLAAASIERNIVHFMLSSP